LHRSTRKLAPSTEGLALFERYAPALDRIFEIERQHADGQEPAGTVRIDLALRIGIETGGSFRVRRIAPGTMILAASPAYLERRGTPRTPRELADHDCLTVSSRQGRSMWRLQGPRGTQEISIDSRFSVNDMRVVMQACLAGLGIALVPRVLAAAAIDEGKLARVLPAYQRSGAGLGLQLVYTSRP
ncbi:substrate binding domain-containing protein, partial [Ralstonia sp. VS2407]